MSMRNCANDGTGKPGLDCSPDRNPVAFSVGPEGDGPNGGGHAYSHKREPKGCEEEYREVCVLGESQMVSRLPPLAMRRVMGDEPGHRQALGQVCCAGRDVLGRTSSLEAVSAGQGTI